MIRQNVIVALGRAARARVPESNQPEKGLLTRRIFVLQETSRRQPNQVRSGNASFPGQPIEIRTQVRREVNLRSRHARQFDSLFYTSPWELYGTGPGMTWTVSASQGTRGTQRLR